MLCPSCIMSIYRESKRGEEKEKEEDSSAKENCSIKCQSPEECSFKSITVGTDFFFFLASISTQLTSIARLNVSVMIRTNSSKHKKSFNQQTSLRSADVARIASYTTLTFITVSVWNPRINRFLQEIWTLCIWWEVCLMAAKQLSVSRRLWIISSRPRTYLCKTK